MAGPTLTLGGTIPYAGALDWMKRRKGWSTGIHLSIPDCGWNAISHFLLRPAAMSSLPWQTVSFLPSAASRQVFDANIEKSDYYTNTVLSGEMSWGQRDGNLQGLSQICWAQKTQDSFGNFSHQNSFCPLSMPRLIEKQTVEKGQSSQEGTPRHTWVEGTEDFQAWEEKRTVNLALRVFLKSCTCFFPQTEFQGAHPAVGFHFYMDEIKVADLWKTSRSQAIPWIPEVLQKEALRLALQHLQPPSVTLRPLGLSSLLACVNLLCCVNFFWVDMNKCLLTPDRTPMTETNNSTQV